MSLGYAHCVLQSPSVPSFSSLEFALSNAASPAAARVAGLGVTVCAEFTALAEARDSEAHKPLARHLARFCFCKTDITLDTAAERLARLT